MSIPLTGISELTVLQCDYTQNRCEKVFLPNTFYQDCFMDKYITRHLGDYGLFSANRWKLFGKRNGEMATGHKRLQ